MASSCFPKGCTAQRPVLLMQGAEMGVIDKNWQKESTSILRRHVILSLGERKALEETETLSTMCFGES